MTINDAIKIALNNKVGVRRKSWPEGVEIRAEHIRVPLNLIIKQSTSHKGGTFPNWNPSPEDFMADDWELIKE